MTRLTTAVLRVAIGALALSAAILQAQTQSDLTQDACARYKKADQALNATYAKVLKD